VDALGRTLMIAGLVFLALGFALHAGPQIPLLGKLPGDLRLERPGFSLYFPFASCVLISVVLSLVLQLLSRLR